MRIVMVHAQRGPDSRGRCPQRDSNPRYGLERAATWTASRWGPKSRITTPGSAALLGSARPKPHTSSEQKSVAIRTARVHNR